ncbi:MAG: hypothetical protein ACLUGF_06765 [Clostridium sp.]
MTPEFSPEVTAYEATVDANSDSLYYSYALQDQKARFRCVAARIFLRK